LAVQTSFFVWSAWESHRWLIAAASALLLCGLGLMLYRRIVVRRARSQAGMLAGMADGWQGIGGPSYAPRPKTVLLTETRLPTVPVTSRQAVRFVSGARTPFGVPDDFDTPGFLASAKRSFVRLQLAWDQADLEELIRCTTEDMFGALSHELRVRANPSRTDIVRLEASLLGIETVGGDQIASVRFFGTIRVNDEEERLDEVWNLSRPTEGTDNWVLAGIQQLN
jgi:predicted lipid-binding transport protein (Tim44 family)